MVVEDKWIHVFPKCTSPKVNVIGWQAFEPTSWLQYCTLAITSWENLPITLIFTYPIFRSACIHGSLTSFHGWNILSLSLSLSLSLHVSIKLYIYIYIYMCVSRRVRMCASVFVIICVSVCMWFCVYTCLCLLVYLIVCMYACVYVCICISGKRLAVSIF